MKPQHFQNIKQLESLLAQTFPAERAELRRILTRLKQRRQTSPKIADPKAFDVRLQSIDRRIRHSIRKKEERARFLPHLTDNESLPIYARKDDIIHAISHHRVVIIAGDTGSGKTTQIPKYCLAAGRGVEGWVGCTQPRRIAAITIAERIAQELGESVGQSVGYKIRFQDRVNANSYIKIMTDGILLAEAQNDRYLNAYDTIIVDEAHERSLNIDFILGILRTLLNRRKNLKLIITSATIDTEKFSAAFDQAPIIEVSGRMYPVDVRYLPSETSKDNDRTYVEQAVLAVDDIIRESSTGDILVFMPTEQDIREAQELIEGRNYPHVVVFPLFARLPSAKQAEVYRQVRSRKVIVATNIAETSLTIPGIKYVVDTGLARISQYLPRSGTTTLPVAPISVSSADQRKGRCGRVENGICIRLFTEEDYARRPVFTLPEILRANLAEVILRMIALKLGDITTFPFIDKPPPKSIKDGYDTLVELGAIEIGSGLSRKKGGGALNRKTSRPRLTENGKLMARIPIDPRLSRMLIEAKKEGCLKEMLVIASALSIQDPRERPMEKAHLADQMQAKFRHSASDFLTLINIWNAYHTEKCSGVSNNQLKKFCTKHFLSVRRMREWCDIHFQIRTILTEEGFLEKSAFQNKPLVLPAIEPEKDESSEFSTRYAAIHRAILSGYLSHIALKKEKNIFIAARNREVMIFPGSGTFNSAGNWVVAAEMVETSRLFARTVARIDNRWIPIIGKALCKYTYLNPHWERKRGQVVAYRQTSLFGLIVDAPKLSAYGKIAPDEASAIFIRCALVEADVNWTVIHKRFPFMKHNQALIRTIKKVEDKIRRRDILISEEDLFQFYIERLEHVYDFKTLEKRIDASGGDAFLRMTESDLSRYRPLENELSLFPEKISLGEMDFECTYAFEPGHVKDGVTVKIPSAVASAVPENAADWVVPGLLKEKLTTLLKGLPKEYRRQLVPIGATVDLILSEMPRTDRALLTALGQFIYDRFKVDIPASAWPQDELPDHLKMRFAILDANGKILQTSRSKTIFRQISKDMPDRSRDLQKEIEHARKKWERTNITKWDFPDLPDCVNIRGHSGKRWILYPGLEEEAGAHNRLNLRLFFDEDQAMAAHRNGVKILFCVNFSKDIKYLKKTLHLGTDCAKYAEYFGGSKIFEKRLQNKIVCDLFLKNIRTKAAFENLAARVGPEIQRYALALAENVLPLLKSYHETRSILYQLEATHVKNQALMQLFTELRVDLNNLVPEKFIDIYPADRFDALIRYIKAMAIRAQRAGVDLVKDRQKSTEIEEFLTGLKMLLQSLSQHTSAAKRSAVEEFFWLLEEYKVSVFAQELKIPVKVSKKRLAEKMNAIKRMI